MSKSPNVGFWTYRGHDGTVKVKPIRLEVPAPERPSNVGRPFRPQAPNKVKPWSAT